MRPGSGIKSANDNQSINQCFILMSVHTKVIVDTHIGIRTSVLHKISITLVREAKSYPSFLNKAVVTGHSSSRLGGKLIWD